MRLIKGSPVTNGENHRLGAYVETSAGGERVRAYVPAPLPPNTPLELGRFMQVYERAIAAFGRLDGVCSGTIRRVPRDQLVRLRGADGLCVHLFAEVSTALVSGWISTVAGSNAPPIYPSLSSCSSWSGSAMALRNSR